MAKVNFEVRGNVGVLTLANPPLNLWDRGLLADWKAAVLAASKAPIRALIVRAEGPYFSGGADVSLFRGTSEADAREMFEEYLPIIRKIETLPYPTIAEVHGLCLAAGMELAMACDLIWAAESSKMGQTEAMIGTSTLLGGIQRIAACCGANRAREIVFGGGHYDARTLEKWNIVNKVVPDADLTQAVFDYATFLANGPTRSHAIGKELIRKQFTGGLDEADQHVIDAAMALFETEDMQHGVATLLDEGVRNLAAKTRFKGR